MILLMSLHYSKPLLGHFRQMQGFECKIFRTRNATFVMESGKSTQNGARWKFVNAKCCYHHCPCLIEKVENQKNHWWWCPWTDFQPASCVSSKCLCEKTFLFVTLVQVTRLSYSNFRLTKFYCSRCPYFFRIKSMYPCDVPLSNKQQIQILHFSDLFSTMIDYELQKVPFLI